MSMIDQERVRELEQFANASPPANMGTVRPLAAPADRVFGAQQVAVHRDEARVLDKISKLAAAAGTDWFYSFEVHRKDGGKDQIEGPSIKLANDVARLYGNCDVDIRVMDLGTSWLFYARFTDFETGYSLTRPFQQRKSQTAMKTSADRALDIAFQIGASKAIRNVICNALQTFADFAYQEAKRSLVDKIGKRLPDYRNRVLQGLANAKIDKTRVERAIGRAADAWVAADVAKIIATMQSISDGMTTWEEAFPPLGTTEPPKEEAAKKPGLDEFVAKAEAGDDERPESVETSHSEPDSEVMPPRESGQSGQGGMEAATPARDPLDIPPELSRRDEASYRAMAEAYIAQASDPDRIQGWLVSDQQRELRRQCGVGKAVYDALRARAQARAAELRKR